MIGGEYDTVARVRRNTDCLVITIPKGIVNVLDLNVGDYVRVKFSKIER